LLRVFCVLCGCASGTSPLDGQVRLLRRHTQATGRPKKKPCILSDVAPRSSLKWEHNVESLHLYSRLITPLQRRRGSNEASARHHSPKIQPRPNATRYLIDPFDIDASNVGPDFAGHDVVAILKAAGAAEPESKSEFETSSQYLERIASFQQAALFGSVKSDSYLAFIDAKFAVDDDSDERAGSGFIFGHYDADKQLFDVTVVGGQNLGKDAIAIRTVKVGQRVYTATNAFGAKINVTAKDFLKYGLATEPGSWVFPEPHGSFPAFKRSIAMPPEKARVFLPHARVLFVCKLSHDHWSLNSHRVKAATFDSPDVSNIEKSYLHVKLEQIWVFDEPTGAVIRKFSSASNESDDVARLKKFPLALKLSVKTASEVQNGLVFVAVDDGKEEMVPVTDKGPTLYADKKIQLRWLVPPDLDLSRLILHVNGSLYLPSGRRLWKIRLYARHPR